MAEDELKEEVAVKMAELKPFMDFVDETRMKLNLPPMPPDIDILGPVDKTYDAASLQSQAMKHTECCRFLERKAYKTTGAGHEYLMNEARLHRIKYRQLAYLWDTAPTVNPSPVSFGGQLMESLYRKMDAMCVAEDTED